MDVAPTIRRQIADIAVIMDISYTEAEALIRELRENDILTVGKVKGYGPIIKLKPDARRSVEQYLQLEDEGPEAV